VKEGSGGNMGLEAEVQERTPAWTPLVATERQGLETEGEKMKKGSLRGPRGRTACVSRRPRQSLDHWLAALGFRKLCLRLPS
jgi:hypothetical protein